MNLNPNDSGPSMNETGSPNDDGRENEKDDYRPPPFATPKTVSFQRGGSIGTPPTPPSIRNAVDIEEERAMQYKSHQDACKKLKDEIMASMKPDVLGKGIVAMFKEKGLDIPSIELSYDIVKIIETPDDEITEDNISEAEFILRIAKKRHRESCESILEESEACEIQRIKSEKRKSLNAPVLPKQIGMSQQEEVLNSVQEKVIRNIRKDKTISEATLTAVAACLKYPSQSNVYSVFASVNTSESYVPPELSAGPLSDLYEAHASTRSFGDPPSDYDSAEQESQEFLVVPMKNDDDLEDDPTKTKHLKHWSWVRRSKEDISEEKTDVCQKILQTNLSGRIIKGDTAVMQLPKQLFYSVRVRREINIHIASALNENMAIIVKKIGATDEQAIRCETLRLKYERSLAVTGEKIKYNESPVNEKVTVKSFVPTFIYDRLNIGLNLLLELVDIFNKRDVRMPVYSTGEFFKNIVIHDKDKLEPRFNALEFHRKQLHEVNWDSIPEWLWDAGGIKIDKTTHTPLFIQEDYFGLGFLLHQIYNCRGTGGTGMATARTAVKQAVKSICGHEPNSDDPLIGVAPSKFKAIIDQVLKSPRYHGLEIDPIDATDKIDLGYSESAPSTTAAFAGISVPRYQKKSIPEMRKQDSSESRGRKPEKGNKVGSPKNGEKLYRGNERGKLLSESKKVYRGAEEGGGLSFATRRDNSLERAKKRHDLLDAYDKEAKLLGTDPSNIEQRANYLIGDFNYLKKSEYGSKFQGGPFVTENGKVKMPLKPVFENNPYEFFRKDRGDVGTLCPTKLWVRFCVFADLFRLTQDGKMTTYGQAYNDSRNDQWEKTTRDFATKYSKGVLKANYSKIDKGVKLN